MGGVGQKKNRACLYLTLYVNLARFYITSGGCGVENFAVYFLEFEPII